MNPVLFARSNCSVRWTHQRGALAGSVLDRIIRSPQLAANTVVGHFGEVGVRPAVIANFMAFVRSARDNFGMFGDIFADHEERHFDVVRSQQVEQFWRERRAWSVIESHGDVGSIDVH